MTGTASAASTGDAPGCGAAPDAIIHQRACPIAQVCPTTLRYGLGCAGPLEQGAEYGPDERCVLEHLAGGAPGAILLEGSCGGELERLSLHVVATGEAMLSVELVELCGAAEVEEGACECPQGRSQWGPLDACALVDATYFEACLSATSAAERADCMTPETWIAGCASASPRCVGG
jgi:hypothetical protein